MLPGMGGIDGTIVAHSLPEDLPYSINVSTDEKHLKFICGFKSRICWWMVYKENNTSITVILHMYAATAAAKSLQSCPTLCFPIDCSPPSLEFSRQEYWSGLPLPSPMHESEKWKWSCSVVSNSSWPSIHGIFQARVPEWVAIAFSNAATSTTQICQTYFLVW